MRFLSHWPLTNLYVNSNCNCSESVLIIILNSNHWTYLLSCVTIRVCVCAQIFALFREFIFFFPLDVDLLMKIYVELSCILIRLGLSCHSQQKCTTP